MFSFIKNKKGTVLITAYVAVFALALLAVASIQRATTEYNFANRYRIGIEAYYLAESGSEQVAYDLARRVAAYEDEPAGPTDSWDELQLVDSDYLSSGFTMNVTCSSVSSEQTTVDASGIVTAIRYYMITATATDTTGGTQATINQVVARKKTYAFQHAVFFVGDLEMVPGQDMILSGKIHCNNDIYIAANNCTLTVDADYLHAAGDIYNYRKDDGQEQSGDVLIKIGGTSSYAKMLEDTDTSPLDSRRSDWLTEALIRWGGTVESGVHGATSLAVPEIASIKPDGYYASQAAVKIVNGDIYSGGALLVEGVDIPAGTVTTDADFYNNREAEYVRMTNIDVKKLAGYEQQVDSEGNPVFDVEGNPVYVQNYPNNLPSNSLLYATRDDAGNTEQPGIRLVNGSEIHSSDGLTVVSDAPVYVQGNFNNSNKKPSAVICDAFNILSNDWNDSNSALGLDSRQVNGTTEVNTAIIAGIVPTTGSNYSGGLENFPRLHEDWEGQTLTIRGAFLSLWDSEVATGQWQFGDPQYKAPNRDWDWDTDFLDALLLPAFTPYAVEVERTAYYREPIKIISKTELSD